MRIFLMDQAESIIVIEYFLIKTLIKRKKIQLLVSDRDYWMTSNEANVMEQLINYVNHCYYN